MSHEVKIWDPLVRIFHWGLVLFFIIAYISGEDESIIHIYSGYAVLGLITFRVFWGIVGTKYARFSDYIYSPKYIAGYFKGLLTGSAKHYLGHNPLGGVMVVVLLMSLFMVSFSGLKLYAVEEGMGPLAVENNITLMSRAYADSDEKYVDNGHDQGEEFWEEIHEFFANFTVFLITLHIAGVFTSGYLHRENLVKAMITGRKKLE